GEILNRRRVLAQGVAGFTEVEVTEDLEGHVARRPSRGASGAMSEGQCALRLAGHPQAVGEMAGGQRASALVAELRRESLSLVQTLAQSGQVAQRHEPVPQVEAEVDGQLLAVTVARQMGPALPARVRTAIP